SLQSCQLRPARKSGWQPKLREDQQHAIPDRRFRLVAADAIRFEVSVFGGSLITTLYLLSAQAASADELPKKVLIFSSDDNSVPGNVLLTKAVRSTVRNGLPEGVHFFYE